MRGATPSTFTPRPPHGEFPADFSGIARSAEAVTRELANLDPDLLRGHGPSGDSCAFLPGRAAALLGTHGDSITRGAGLAACRWPDHPRMGADNSADESEGDRRRFRVPYEWALGAMFVGTFCVARWTDSWASRGIWLLLVMPLACTSLRVRRRRGEPSPRFGASAVTAAAGWLYIVTAYVLVEYKYEIGRAAVERVLEFAWWTWPIPPLLSLACLVLAAARRGRYREFGVFANAAALLAFAWGRDLALSPVS